jgi:hypothetical protein
VASASTAWRICSREVNSTSAPYSTRARSVQQGLDHLGGELRGVLRVGVRLGGDQVPCAA